MGKRICEICGSNEKSKPGFFANFPLDEKRCKEWVRVVGKVDFVYVPIERLHQLRFVCGVHFLKKDINKKGNKLLKRAIPKLKITATPLTEEQLHGFPFHVASKSGAIKDAPSTSATSIQQSCSTVKHDHSYNMQPQPSTCQLLIDAQPGPSTRVQAFPTNTAQEACSFEENQFLKNQHEQLYTAAHGQNEMTPKKQVVVQYVLQKGSKKIGKRKIMDDIDLTPRKKKLVDQLKKTKCTLSSLKKSAKLLESVNSTVLKDLISADLKNHKRKPKGRRWTLKEKIAALAILKRSPKTYRFLENGLMLPSIKTLNNLLRKIPMETGINKAVLQHLQKRSPSMEEHNKLCVLLFDEIALKPRLIFNEATDQVDGYEDRGKHTESGRTHRTANHALVFMMQGLRARYKQVIAYYFVKGTVSSQQLAAYIKELIKAINDTGFRVISTVCDQGPTNMGALKLLKEGALTRQQFTGPIEGCNFFITDGKKYYIMYDIPHLFKSIRNNFMNHGQIEIERNRGKWSHLYEVEEKNKSLLYLSKITSTHVRPKYRAKMKVKYAAQALSNTVSAVLKLMSLAESDDQRKKEIMQTGLVIELLDRLFDATNGPSCKDDIKRGQRQNVSVTSNHTELWSNLKKNISTLKFIKNDGTEAKNVKCIQGMLISLATLQDLWKDVRNLGFRYLNLRSLNQDGLENFFGIIRQHSPTNRNPTCAGFIAALKTSVVSGMTAPHSKSSNCEKDNKVLLTNFEDTLLESDQTHEEHLEAVTVSTTDLNTDVVVPKQGSNISSDNADNYPLLNIPEELEFETDLSQIKFQPLVYVCGYLMSTLKTLDCAVCRSLLIEDDEEKMQSELYQYIQLREWWGDKQSLTYPSLPLCHMLETATDVFQRELIPRLHELNISALCTTVFTANCELTWFTCHHRNYILDVILGRLARLLIRRQCQRANQELAEHEERIKDLTKIAEQGFN